MNWGKGIIFSFVLFAAFIAILVTVCVRQDISLVSANYYKDELDYQSQIERMSNYQSLDTKPIISVEGGTYIKISFHDFPEIQSGEFYLYSPGNESRDKKFRILNSVNGEQLFDVGEVKKGMYKARVTWLMKGKEYYFEETINI